jgi:hypothetical protein
MACRGELELKLEAPPVSLKRRILKSTLSISTTLEDLCQNEEVQRSLGHHLLYHFHLISSREAQ